MTVNGTATPAEQLRLYRTRHRIEIDPSGDWTTCETDGLRVYTVRGHRWQHDAAQIKRLEIAAYSEQARVAAAVERIIADFDAYMGDDDLDEIGYGDDRNPEGDPTRNGAF